MAIVSMVTWKCNSSISGLNISFFGDRCKRYLGKGVGIMQVCRLAAVKAYYTSVRGQLYRTGRNPRGAKEDFENCFYDSGDVVLY